MANPRSIARIEARIRERVAYCVEFELKDPRATFTTVTRVEVSSDLSLAKIFYTVLGTEGDKSKVAHMLVDASGFVRRQIGRVLHTRRIPQVRWFYDDSIEIRENMDQAIARALERDRKINPNAHLSDDAATGGESAGEADAATDEQRTVDAEYLDYLNAQEKEDE